MYISPKLPPPILRVILYLLLTKLFAIVRHLQYFDLFYSMKRQIDVPVLFYKDDAIQAIFCYLYIFYLTGHTHLLTILQYCYV